MKDAYIYIGNALEWEDKNFYDLSHRYSVSIDGHIYDKEKKEYLSEFIHDGYYYVLLYINGKEKKCKVHRIVACSYPEICGKFNEVVNHLDENKLNNNAYNLKWVTNKENNEWGTIKERIKETCKMKRKFFHTIEQEKIPLFKKGYKYTLKKNNENNFVYTSGNATIYSKECSDIIDYDKSYLNIYNMKISLKKIIDLYNQNNGIIHIADILSTE